MINPVGVTTEEYLVSYFQQTRLIDVVLLASKLNVTLLNFHSIVMTAPDARKRQIPGQNDMRLEAGL